MHIKVGQADVPDLPEGGLLQELDTESLPPISSEEPSDLPWVHDTDDAR